MTREGLGSSKGDPEEVVLLAQDVSKSYGGIDALRGVSFKARRGAVNVLVGENGAGKSTLMKILSGSEQPSAGRILLDGASVRLDSPRDAMDAGIGIIHQELSLFPNMSIAENMFAGRELTKPGRGVDFGTQRERARSALERLGQHLSPDAAVADLPIGQQQLVEIGRTLLLDVRVLIMDEPTSALSNQEVDVLFSVIDDLKRGGVTIIYISHKLDEFRRVGDYVTVLRDGRVVAEAAMSETDTAWIVRQMVGKDPSTLFEAAPQAAEGVVLEVRALTVPGPRRPLVDTVSLSVRAGEVVGIYGLMGAGRTELVEAIMGIRPAISGEVLVGGKRVRATVAERIRAGLALVPEDRQRHGLVRTMSVKDNLTLSTLDRLTRRAILTPRRERTAALEQVERLGIKLPDLGAPVTSLSGGNQQKVVIGRALLTNPAVLLLDEPTRGVDVGAKSQIAQTIADLARQGVGILFVSSELAEVTTMADRVLVMTTGRITANLCAEDVTEEHLVAASASKAAVKESA